MTNLKGKMSKSGMIPAKSELEVLKVLWKYGPSSVRFVHDKLSEGTKTVRYTSTLKIMQVMHEKGMVRRDESNMRHVYKANLEEQKTIGFLVQNFVDTIYNGSFRNLLVAFVNTGKFSKKDLKKAQELLDLLEEKGDS
jgi:BlaI family penicillinase repressor